MVVLVVAMLYGGRYGCRLLTLPYFNVVITHYNTAVHTHTHTRNAEYQDKAACVSQ